MKKQHRIGIGVAVAAAAILLLAWVGRDAPSSRTVSIAAAADLRYALQEITAEFARDAPDVHVDVSYGSSGNFYAQLRNGAPFDLFLSADVEYPRQLTQHGLTLPGSEFTYAEGRIVVWVPRASSLDVEARGLEALTDPAIEHIAIANPEHAPYGRAAQAAMRAAGMLDRVRPKLVFGENISQTLQFVQSGSADIGIVALSLALAPPVAPAGRYWLIPVSAHSPIEQGGAIMRASARANDALRFRAFLLGDHARGVLSRYGFALPGR